MIQNLESQDFDFERAANELDEILEEIDPLVISSIEDQLGELNG